MTFFEKAFHRFFDDAEHISANAVFTGKTMITPISENLRAKIQFVHTNVVDNYNALRVIIINRNEGTIDNEIFKFKDIIGMKGNIEPHIWDDEPNIGWYIYKPTANDYNIISNAIVDYISMYADHNYKNRRNGNESKST